MRTILLLLLVFTFHAALSQNWEEIEIDDKVSIKIPGEHNKTASGNNIKISAITAKGDISIDRYDLPDSLYHKEYNLDPLEPYAKGYITGMQFGKKVELLSNNEVFIKDLRAREVLLSNKDDRVVQIYFFIIDRKMYTIKFTENKSPSDTDREKIFSSIQIM
ncbi:hypothetical protein [Marivirga sp.]|uniref:hypothetical protein n=1 Tax=Marivirga sp. TaxID=2018662 RepID=UPI003DA76DAF